MKNADSEMASYFGSSSSLSNSGSCAFEAALKQYQGGQSLASHQTEPKTLGAYSQKVAAEFEVREHCLNGRWTKAWQLVERYQLDTGITRRQWETEMRLKISTCPKLNQLPF